jgi:hypothetical protein
MPGRNENASNQEPHHVVAAPEREIMQLRLSTLPWLIQYKFNKLRCGAFLVQNSKMYTLQSALTRKMMWLFAASASKHWQMSNVDHIQ